MIQNQALALLGQNPSCKLADDQKGINIRLGSNATVVVNDSIILNPNVI